MTGKHLQICFAAVAILGCGSEASTKGDECNPLGGPACMMPWPSSAYLQVDESTATGFRVDFPVEAMPVNADGIVVDPASFNQYDGFPLAGVLIADFPEGVSGEGLPSIHDIGESMEADASVIVVNMESGERLPLFAEPDRNASVPSEQALLIRPLKRMEPGTRYAVGVSSKARSGSGGDIARPEGFAKLMDGKSLSGERGKRVEENFEAALAALEGAGMQRDDLVLAWDFVTASDEFLTRDVLTMRDIAIETIGAGEFGFDLGTLENSNPDSVLRVIHGTFEVPMFLTDAESDKSTIGRSAEGLPELQGTGQANITAVIPRCVETVELPIPVVMFGHGMFGNGKATLDEEFLQDMANDQCAVLVATDWIGLTDRQLASVAFAMNEVNRGVAITEKLAQAVVNHLALQRHLQGAMSGAELFLHEGNAIVDTGRVQYFGASLGGLLGAVYAAYDPNISRVALGVAGGSWSLLFERSVFWPPLRITMKGAYPEPWDYQQNIALMGMLFEKVDPMTAATRLLKNLLPGTQEKQVLLYVARGDALVANVASDALARTMDLKVITPSVVMPFGMTPGKTSGTSGYVIYDEEVSPWPPDHNALEDLEYNKTHGDVHKRGAVQRQVFRLLNTGVVANECFVDDEPAPCLCTTGACE